jgi:hypothetical protein
MMQSALRKVGPSPYSLSVMAGILLVTVTAYPQSLDQSTAFKEKKTVAAAQYVQPASKNTGASYK